MFWVGLFFLCLALHEFEPVTHFVALNFCCADSLSEGLHFKVFFANGYMF